MSASIVSPDCGAAFVAGDPDFNLPFYQANGRTLTTYPMLRGALRAEICVVGGGMLGLSAALRLAQAGRDVVLVDAGRIGGGASGRNGGFVLPGLTAGIDATIDLLGERPARALWQDTLSAVDLVADLAARHAPEAGFRRGVATAAAAPAHALHLRSSATLARDVLGQTGLRWHDAEAARAIVASDAYHGVLEDSRAGQVDPWRLMQGLALAARAAGVRIYERSEVCAVVDGGGDEPATVQTREGSVAADAVVIAANVACGDLIPAVNGQTVRIHSYVVATAPLAPGLARRLLPQHHAVYDTRFALNYFRLDAEDRLIFGGGFGFRPWSPARIRKVLGREMTRLFPELTGTPILHGWGGEIDLSRNRMTQFRRIGRLWLGHGFSGHGVALAAWGGQAIADAIGGEAAAFARLAAVPHAAPPRLKLLAWSQIALDTVGAWAKAILPSGAMISL